MLTPSMLIGIMIIQGATISALWFLPFGFDQRSSVGLDYDHLILFRCLYGAAFCLGVALCTLQKPATRPAWLLGQIAVPFITLPVVWIAWVIVNGLLLFVD